MTYIAGMQSSKASLPYEETGIVAILTLSSFLLLSNTVKWALDRLLYCGIIGQILVGVAWGTPGGNWLGESIETAVVQLGYLGLILLVYEGGLSTSFQSLKANLLLSIAIALTGICAPIGLSFTLRGIVNATPLQGFAAGAALCSTSLGTTFAMLTTTGLITTRLGVVLSTAAMLDDVVGLVMVQVINNLGSASSNPSTMIILRPCLASFGFAIICPLLCWLIIKPMTPRINSQRKQKSKGFLNRVLSREEFAFSAHTVLLVGMLAGATYAGTSNLFAAYLAGAMISWWDTELPHFHHLNTASSQQPDANTSDVSKEGMTNNNNMVDRAHTGTAIYKKYYSTVNEKILKPFFFTSIGFSIPITRMFSGSTVWRGLVYSILMALAKMLCGIWLVRFFAKLSSPVRICGLIDAIKSVHIPHSWGKHSTNFATEGSVVGSTKSKHENPAGSEVHTETALQPAEQNLTLVTASQKNMPAEKPVSLYPAAILGLAMVSRGEIGFLISSLADSNGIFSSNGNDQVFLIATWAIVLCTVIGPLGVGLLVLRVKRLEKKNNGQSDGRDVLGVWCRSMTPIAL